MENNKTEYKREYTDDIRYAVVAFANTDGGEILIGINDDGSVRGVDEPDKVTLRATNMIRDAIRPDVTMFTSCSVSERDGKPIVAISVQRGASRPYYLSGKGVRPEGVYVRQGSSSVPASQTAILNMIRETAGDRYEDGRSIEQDLTFRSAAAYFKKMNVDFGDKQMRTLNMLDADGAYTNLALLLSDECPHSVKLAVFDGGKKTVFRDRRELNGSLFDQIEDAYSFIDRYNRVRSDFSGLERIDSRDYPPEAIREALLNAVVHRDYSLSGPTLISIFDDRIEFTSLGGLLRGISYNDIMLGVSALRNERLANVFFRLRLIEAYGTGLLKIKECYADLPQKPKIEVSDHAFKITLPNTRFQPSVAHTAAREEPNEREKAVLRLFERKDALTRQEIQNALKLSQATVILLLKKMIGDGMIRKEGSGRNTAYRKVV